MTTTNLDLLVIALIIVVAHAIAVSRLAPVIAAFFARLTHHAHHAAPTAASSCAALPSTRHLR